jgi:hypothetical protein
MPTLGRPATSEDVAQGRAIFFLTGNTRTVAIGKFPLEASCLKAGKKHPEIPLEEGLKGDDDQDDGSKIWQAEEVQVGGRWERYYGFAGRHLFAKVPAAEVEFPRAGDVDLAPAIECWISPAANHFDAGLEQSFLVTGLQKPLPFNLGVHNYGGLDQLIPGPFILPANNARTLPAAVRFTLSYSEKMPPAPTAREFASNMQNRVPVDYGSWQDIPLRKEITMAGPADARAIGPDARIELLKIDLRDYFKITRPGTYRLDVTFQEPGQKASPTQHVFYNLVGEGERAAN